MAERPLTSDYSTKIDLAEDSVEPSPSSIQNSGNYETANSSNLEKDENNADSSKNKDNRSDEIEIGVEAITYYDDSKENFHTGEIVNHPGNNDLAELINNESEGNNAHFNPGFSNIGEYSMEDYSRPLVMRRRSSSVGVAGDFSVDHFGPLSAFDESLELRYGNKRSRDLHSARNRFKITSVSASDLQNLDKRELRGAPEKVGCFKPIRRSASDIRHGRRVESRSPKQKICSSKGRDLNDSLDKETETEELFTKIKCPRSLSKIFNPDGEYVPRAAHEQSDGAVAGPSGLCRHNSGTATGSKLKSILKREESFNSSRTSTNSTSRVNFESSPEVVNIPSYFIDEHKCPDRSEVPGAAWWFPYLHSWSEYLKDVKPDGDVTDIFHFQGVEEDSYHLTGPSNRFKYLKLRVCLFLGFILSYIEIMARWIFLNSSFNEVPETAERKRKVVIATMLPNILALISSYCYPYLRRHVMSALGEVKIDRELIKNYPLVYTFPVPPGWTKFGSYTYSHISVDMLMSDEDLQDVPQAAEVSWRCNLL